MSKALPQHTTSTHEQIAALAHTLWERAGGPAERDLEFWLKAEHQLAAPSRGAGGLAAGSFHLLPHPHHDLAPEHWNAGFLMPVAPRAGVGCNGVLLPGKFRTPGSAPILARSRHAPNCPVW